MDIQIGDIGHIIQLAIAPVFLLSGVGTNLMVLTSRLARIIDRSRVLEGRMAADDGKERGACQQELDLLYRRMHLINVAITLATTCALLICMVIAALFIGDALGLELGKLIAAMFVLGMFALIGSLLYLLREIFVATNALARPSHSGRVANRRRGKH